MVSPPIPSDDGLAVQGFVPINSDADIGTVVASVTNSDPAPQMAALYVLARQVWCRSGRSPLVSMALAGRGIIGVHYSGVVCDRSYRLRSYQQYVCTYTLLTVWWLANGNHLLVADSRYPLYSRVGAATGYRCCW